MYYLRLRVEGHKGHGKKMGKQRSKLFLNGLQGRRQFFMQTSRQIFMETSRRIFMETSRRIFMEHHCEPHINAVNITYEHHGVFFGNGNITAANFSQFYL